MVKVKFIKSLYPFATGQVADVTDTVYNNWKGKGYFKDTGIKIDIKVQKVIQNKSMQGKKKSNKSLQS